MNKPNCYECKYRRDLVGDAHSRCVHPLLKEVDTANIFSLFSNPNILVEAIIAMQIKANEHGINQGWFLFPFNFDPVWLENCNGFEKKEK